MNRYFPAFPRVWLARFGRGASLAAIALFAALLDVPFSTPLRAAPSRPPNVLFIGIDDQNDWIGAMGGHPLARTPNIDRLARRGTLFLNAHCQAPLCNPSRSSLLLGLRPTTTGIYGLSPAFRSLTNLAQRTTLPQHFKAAGYRTLVTGKIYHHGFGSPENKAREFDVWGPAGGIGVKPAQKLIPPTPMGNHPLMDWGAFPHRDDEKGDFQIATWAMDQLRSAPREQPLFLAVGFFLPHVPCYVPPAWFDLFPNDDRLLPPVLPHDRDDTPAFSWRLHWRLPEPRLQWVQDQNQWRNLSRSYLASTAFIDAQIGRLLDTLDALGQTDQTVIVLWSDHGFHLGEKAITGKNSLWERSTRVPLIFAGPKITPGGRCSQPAELLDLYPTLIDLCNLPPRNDLEGLSLLPQLKDPAARRDRPALTSHNQGNHAVRTDRWRYIRYADGSEELYDHASDPNEWFNLASRPDSLPILGRLRAWLPKLDSPPAPGSADRVLTYNPVTDEAVWEGTKVPRSAAIPE